MPDTTDNAAAKAQPSPTIFRPRLILIVLAIWLVTGGALLAAGVRGPALSNDLVTLVTVTGLVLAGLWAREGRLERRRAKLAPLRPCPSCGYSLAGLAAGTSCPECGGKSAGTP